MRPMNKHGKAARADDFLYTLMIAREIYPGLIIRAANKTFQLNVRHIIPPALR
jgi:hypothetical protein